MDCIDVTALPLGFGFHPTDAELVSHYLKRKIMGIKDEYDVIPEVDIYKHEPWDLPAKSGIPSRECKWHFFNIRDRKYPNGSRSNRATRKGYWKSTGKDRMIRSHSRNLGTKKTLVFHEGRPPLGKRTDWIMHEYYLDEKDLKAAGVPKDIFVLCRVTKRNGFASVDEEGCCQIEKSDGSMTPLFHESFPKSFGGAIELKRQKVEPPSLFEHEDYDDWFNELYFDPKFPELDNLDSSFISPMHKPENLLLTWQSYLLDCPNFIDSSCGWPEIYAKDSPSTHTFDPSKNSVPDILTGLTESHEDMPNDVERAEEKVEDQILNACGLPADSSDTGIIIRQRALRPFVETSGHRIKLQVHKMETWNPGALNHMVMLEGSNCHLDSNDSVEVHSMFVGKNELPQGPHSKCHKDPRTWRDIKRSLQGALKEARSFVRRCSSFGLNCLFVATCLVGAVAMTAYLHQEDA